MIVRSHGISGRKWEVAAGSDSEQQRCDSVAGRGAGSCRYRTGCETSREAEGRRIEIRIVQTSNFGHPSELQTVRAELFADVCLQVMRLARSVEPAAIPEAGVALHAEAGEGL